jgi:hypothetical protein
MESPSGKKSALAPGWILVSGLLLLCVTFTWLTAHNYKKSVFSSARGVVLENQPLGSRLSVPFKKSEARAICPGQMANITIGNDTHLLKGFVVSVIPEKAEEGGAGDAMVIIRLVGEPGSGAAGGVSPSPNFHHFLPVGATCSVTIDTTIPPETIPPETSVAR